MDNNKIIKVKRRKTFNIGVLIFLLIFIYIIIYIIMFFSKPHLSIYEVQRETLSINSVTTGVIIREETIVTTDKAGKISYYLRDGARVMKNAIVYSIDDSNIFDNLRSNYSYEINEYDVIQIKNKISSFQKKYSDNDYSVANKFRDDITVQIQQMIDINLSEQFFTYTQESGISLDYNAVYSDKTGIISYHVDSLDGIQENKVSSHTFEVDDFTETNVRTTELHEAGSKAYKLITSEEWKVIAPIDKSVYDLLLDNQKVKIKIKEDDFVVTVSSEVFMNGSEYYVKLSFDNYMIRYKNMRFLEIEFLIHADIGLKIPLSSITEKEFFMVPLYCFTYGGNESNEKGLIIRNENDFTFKKTEIYYDNGEYAYVDKNDFSYNDYVIVPESANSDKSEIRISAIGRLDGVYNVNKGFAVFRRIEKISTNDEYCIVKEGTSNGLAIYDHIALDALTAIEEKSIY